MGGTTLLNLRNTLIYRDLHRKIVEKPYLYTMSKQLIVPILSFLAIISLIIIVVFRKDPAPIYPVREVKTIEKAVQGKEKEIHNYFTQVNNEKKIIDAISKEIKDLRLQLDQVKSEKDTVLIIQIQDTLINLLTNENKHLRNVITNQDSIITAQRYIINSKDTIIAVKDNQIKKVKRQRNWSLAANGVLTGLVILNSVK